MFQKTLATFEIMRPHNMAAAGACVYSGYFLCGAREWGPIAWPVVLAAISAGLGNLINDVFDADIDRVNKPRRPIPSGRLTVRWAASVYALGTAASIAAMFVFLSGRVLALMILWQALLFAYAIRAKRIALVGNVLIAAICSSAFLVGPMVAPSALVVFPPAFAFVFVMGRELVKGAEDVEGDRAAKARTLAVLYGAERSARWGALLLLACAIAAPLPALTGGFSHDYGLMAEAAILPGLLAAAWLVLQRPRREVFHLAAWILKLEMLIGIVAVGLGRTSF